MAIPITLFSYFSYLVQKAIAEINTFSPNTYGIDIPLSATLTSEGP